jgi:segregation and condensation protein A
VENMNQLIDIIHEPNWKSMLYDLIRTNELSLWNIDLITLTDLYLEKIKTMQEENLIVPANALLAAAILLKLKAYSLKLSTIEDEEEPLILPQAEEFSTKIDFMTPTRLKEGQISLEELIDVVEVVMNKPTQRNIQKKIKEQKEFSFTIPEKTKDILERIEEFYENIKQNKDTQNLVLFSTVTKKINSKSIVNDCFLPMLFLAMDKRIDVWQEDFFSEIFIKLI